MSKYELFYFNSRGRAEVARILFAQAGVQYVDTRCNGRDDWLANYKSKSPFGIAPWLEVDGKKIGGGREIARFLGERFGLAGSDDVENAQLGSYADFCDDMLTEAARAIEAKDDAEKARMKEVFDAKNPKWLDVFEGKIGDSGWLYGSKLTWVDCHVAHYLSLIVELGSPNLLRNYPKLSALIKNVEGQPKIAEWMKKRPKTEH